MRPALAAWRAKLAIAAHSLARAWRESFLRVLGMALLAAASLAGTFTLFLRAFDFLGGLEIVGPILLVRLLSLFFFVLFVMLVMSNVLVGFQTLFRSREVDFWAVQPLPAETVHDIRSLEVAVIASWAFAFLGLPLLWAHGRALHAGAAYFALVPLVLATFAAVAHALGMLVVVTLVRLFPGLDLKRLVAIAVAALVPVVVAIARAFRIRQIGPEDDASELLVHALEGLARTQYPMLPGYWAAETLRAAARGDLARCAFFGWALAVTAAFLGMLAREASRRWLVVSQQTLRGRGLAGSLSRRTRRRTGAPAKGPLRALALKDALLFLREPAQWSQALLVGVLASVYVLNLRNLPNLAQLGTWGRVAASLNAGVVLLLMGTLATRFAFPLVSLEGRRAWIVFVAPLRRESVVRQKFAVALAVTLPLGLAAAVASTGVLGVPQQTRALTIGASALGALALSGLATGLGALFPNFTEDNPARIVSGFGGTVTFLAGLAYAACMTALLGLPEAALALGRIDEGSLAAWTRVASSAAALLSLGVMLVPLALGARQLREREA